MMDETVTSSLRPLLEGLTFTIAGHPEHLPHCASAYEGDLIKEFGSEIGLNRANTKQKRDSSGTEATRRLHNKRNNRSRGKDRGWSNLRVLRAPSHICFLSLTYTLTVSVHNKILYLLVHYNTPYLIIHFNI